MHPSKKKDREREEKKNKIVDQKSFLERKAKVSF